MAWLELDPDPTHDAVAVEHMTRHESAVMHDDWEHEARIAQEMAEAGVRSNDEFVNRQRHVSQVATPQVVTPPQNG